MERAMRRTLTASFVVVAASLTLGCTPLTSPLDLAGSYSLKSVNGLPVPYTFPADGSTVVLVEDDVFTLNPGGTYAESGQEQVTTAGVPSVRPVIDAGYFTRRNNTVTLESLLVGTRDASIQGGTFTLVQQGITLVYQK